MKRILITGAAGFLGYLCDRFIKEGYYVIRWTIITGDLKY
jgi:nucleoside-diphosphate-sugar epimerase